MEFGESLLGANEERIKAIDAKATMIVGYSTAILAFLVNRDVQLAGEPVLKVFLILSATAAGSAACYFSGMTLRAAQNWQALGEATWFPNDGVTAKEPDRLRRFYLKAMHQTLQENHRKTNIKAQALIKAQLSVALAGMLLGASLVADLTYSLAKATRLFG